jgi:hypothetical protein
MKIQFEIRGVDALMAKLKDTQKAIPYATATALTWLAKDAQRAILDLTQGAFRIKGNWLTGRGRYGVLVSPATKDHLESNVRNAAPWMMDHATGGTRVASRSRHYAFSVGGRTVEAPAGNFFAIPTYGRGMKDRRWLYRGATPVAIKMWGDGSGTVYGRYNGKFVPMASLKPSVKIIKRWFFIEAGMATIEAKQGERLQQAADLMLEKFK